MECRMELLFVGAWGKWGLCAECRVVVLVGGDICSCGAPIFSSHYLSVFSRATASSLNRSLLFKFPRCYNPLEERSKGSISSSERKNDPIDRVLLGGSKLVPR